MGKKSKPPAAPDLTPISDAQIKIAEQSNELAREFMGLSREQYAFMQENAKEELALAREQADRLMELQNKAFDSDEAARLFSEEVGRTQMAAMQQLQDYAAKDRERYESVFLPMQDQYIKEANEYDTPDRREAEASRASVDIQRQAEAARTNADQRLRSMGLDPSQMRSSTLLDTQGVALAAQQAGAANAARTQVEDRGRAMRADALNLGQGLPAQALSGYNASSQAGNSAVNAGQANQGAQLGAIQGGAGVAGTALGYRSNALSALGQLTGSPTQWAGMGSNSLGQASSAYGNAASTINSGYQNQMSTWQARQNQQQQGINNIMSVGSMFAGAMMAEGGAPDVEREAIRFDEDIRVSPGPLRVSVSTPGVKAPGLMERLKNRIPTDSSTYQPPETVFDDPSQYRSRTSYTELGGDAMRWAAEGGRQRARGALPMRQSRDTIPAMLSEGEYVVPADVVRSKGLEFFDNLVKRYHRSNA